MTQLRHFIFNTTTTVTGVTYNGFHVISLKHIETISKSVPHHKDSQRDTTPLNIFFNTIKYPRIGHNWYAKVLRMFLNRLILKPRAQVPLNFLTTAYTWTSYISDTSLIAWYIRSARSARFRRSRAMPGTRSHRRPGTLHAASTVTRPETKRKKRDVQ